MLKGDWFKVVGRSGVFQFHHEYNGDIVAYGGSKDPEGQRQYEAFSADEIFVPAEAPFTKKKEREVEGLEDC